MAINLPQALAQAAEQALVSPAWAVLALALIVARDAVTRWAPSA